MAVFGAVIDYILQMASFLLLRKKQLDRPYVSPLGVAGTWVAILIAAITLVVLFLNPDYNKGVYGAAFYARKRLVLSPEEECALKWN